MQPPGTRLLSNHEPSSLGPPEVLVPNAALLLLVVVLPIASLVHFPRVGLLGLSAQLPMQSAGWQVGRLSPLELSPPSPKLPTQPLPVFSL